MYKKILIMLILTGIVYGADSTKSEIKERWNRSFGFEINPIYLVLSQKDNTDITGTISIFKISRKMEIAFPIEYIYREDIDKEWDEIYKYKRFSIDCQSRYFLKGTQGGLYFSAGLRYAYEYGLDYDLYWDEEEMNGITNNKLGISFGIGYRYYSPSGFYWGVSFYAGKYLTDNKTMIEALSGVGYRPDIFAALELLKFGYAFK